MSKTIVFISGSSKIKHLNNEMTDVLDKLIALTLRPEVIIGDCYGVDELVQKYLKKHNYENVTVYCSSQEPRWKRCSYDKYVSLWDKAQGKQGEDFYQVKDKAMCEACDYAIAFWNGVSYGVKCNIERLKSMKKQVLVIVQPIE